MSSVSISVDAPAAAVEQARAGRDLRYRRREQLRQVTTSRAVSRCGTPLASSDVTVAFDGQTAGFGGVVCCGNPWLCPRCSAVLAVVRGAEVQRAVAEALRLGCRVLAVTFTVRHRCGDDLRDLLDAMVPAWTAATSGRSWRADSERYGVLGHVRSIEVTTGGNGWHPHIHALLFVKGVDADLAGFAASMWDRYTARLRKAGYGATAAIRGQAKGFHQRLIARPGDGEAYLVKGLVPSRPDTVGLEVTGGMLKKGRKTRTMLDVLDSALAGNEADLRLWWVYESAVSGRLERGGEGEADRRRAGRRHVTWARRRKHHRIDGLDHTETPWSVETIDPETGEVVYLHLTEREHLWNLILDARQEVEDDQQAAARELSEDSVIVAVVPRKGYIRLLRSGEALALLHLVEQTGGDFAAVALEAFARWRLTLLPPGGPPS